jgi:hypothetical protein
VSARRAACAVALVLVAGATDVYAHSRSVSYSSWQLDDTGARIELRIARVELTRLSPDQRQPDALASYLVEHLALVSDDGVCPALERPVLRPDREDRALFVWRVDCSTVRGTDPASQKLAIRSGVLLGAAPAHLHFARVALPDGSVRERVLSAAEPSWPLARPAGADGGAAGANSGAAGTTLAGYVALGVEHILTGWDHLAFVLALLLLAGTLGEVATLVTGFTIAHSVTLGLAVLGWVRPETAPVEALIGYSIALVAAENAWILSGRDRWIPLVATAGLGALAGAAALGYGTVSALTLLGLALFSACHFGLLGSSQRPARLRVAIAFAFGLVHGFGFAGVLGELELPTARLAPALFGFNVGVELGQLAVVVLAWPLLRWAQRTGSGRVGPWLVEGGSAAICGLGLFWFLTRWAGPW